MQFQKSKIIKYNINQLEDCIKKVNELDYNLTRYEENILNKFKAVKLIKNIYQFKLMDYKKCLLNDEYEELTEEIKKEKGNEINYTSKLFLNLISSVLGDNDEGKQIKYKINQINESAFDIMNNNKKEKKNHNIHNQNINEKFSEPVKLVSNTPFLFGCIFNNEPTKIISYPKGNDLAIIGFKNGSISLGRIKDNRMAISPECQLNFGSISQIKIFEGEELYGNYLIFTQMNALLLVNPIKVGTTISLNPMILAYLEEEQSTFLSDEAKKINFIEMGGNNFCISYKNNIYIWKGNREKEGRYTFKKINFKAKIDGIVQVSKNNILGLVSSLNQLILINIDTFEKEEIDLKAIYNITLNKSSSIIQLTKAHFLINNGYRMEIFHFDNFLLRVNSILKKKKSCFLDFKKFKKDYFLIIEREGEEKWISKYKINIKNEEVKFVLDGEPYHFDMLKSIQDFCIYEDNKLIILEKNSNKGYIFKI